MSSYLFESHSANENVKLRSWRIFLWVFDEEGSEVWKELFISDWKLLTPFLPSVSKIVQNSDHLNLKVLKF